MKKTHFPALPSYSILFVALLTAMLFINTGSASFRKQRDLSQKEAFQQRFPLTLSFRNDRLGQRDGYDFWERQHLPYNAITKKFLQEEIDIDPVLPAMANQFARNHPEKLMLIHLNGECTSAEDRNTHKTYFPGHWVYLAGTVPLESISRSQQEIRVASAAPFSMEAHTIHGGVRRGQKLPDNVLLVRLDDNGNRLWHESEYAILEAVDHERNTITLKRGQYFSKPISFEQGNTYIAPIASDHWGGYMMWYYNLATTCPVDKKGKSCSDVWLDQITKWFGRSGILKDIDGIGYDVLYFDQSTKQHLWDLDNDGVADGGVIDGTNAYRLGTWAFLKALRERFGDEFLITADGWADGMQRAVGVLNGMETEGICRPNDGYRQVSRTINQHTYWNMHNDAKYGFSYITDKLRHVNDSLMLVPLKRMGMGLASCLGVAFAISPPMPLLLEAEALGGMLDEPNWLGKPVSDMVYTEQHAVDLLHGGGQRMDRQFLNRFDFADVDFRSEDGVLYVTGKKDDPYAGISLKGPEVDLAEGDLLVFFEAKALKGFYDLEEPNRVPRMINIKLEGYPIDADEPRFSMNFANQLAGFMGTPGYTPQVFYFRNAGGGDRPLRLIFEAEEQGGFAIRKLRVVNAPCAIAREFENGVVLVNPSKNAYDFNLSALFPDVSGFKRLDAIRRSSGRYAGFMDEVMQHNNGASETGMVEVPGLNALFLKKN